MKYILLFLVLFSAACRADSDSVQAQQGTQLTTYNTFKTSEGVELRVVEFYKPSIHHFFAFDNNHIFMNSVADKQKNLREVRFAHNQFELEPYAAPIETQLLWTMDTIKAVQAKATNALNNTPLESRTSRVLIENLSRGCGNVQVLGELNSDKSAIDHMVVKVDGVGELHVDKDIEGVSCDDKTLMVGTVSCYGEKGPCYQKLVGVQYREDDLVPSDHGLLKKVYGEVDTTGAILNLPKDSAPIYTYVLLTRYVELNYRALMYVITKESESDGRNSYCSSCVASLKISFFELVDGEWQTLGSQVEQSVYGWPSGTYYLDNIGKRKVGLIYQENNSRGGEGYFEFSIYKIDPTTTQEVLSRHHYYEYNSFCEVSKSNYSTIELINSGDMYDVKMKIGHYNDAECKKIKYLNEEQLYRFAEGKYNIIKEKTH